MTIMQHNLKAVGMPIHQHIEGICSKCSQPFIPRLAKQRYCYECRSLPAWEHYEGVDAVFLEAMKREYYFEKGELRHG